MTPKVLLCRLSVVPACLSISVLRKTDIVWCSDCPRCLKQELSHWSGFRARGKNWAKHLDLPRFVQPTFQIAVGLLLVVESWTHKSQQKYCSPHPGHPFCHHLKSNPLKSLRNLVPLHRGPYDQMHNLSTHCWVSAGFHSRMCYAAVCLVSDVTQNDFLFSFLY